MTRVSACARTPVILSVGINGTAEYREGMGYLVCLLYACVGKAWFGVVPMPTTGSSMT